MIRTGFVFLGVAVLTVVYGMRILLLARFKSDRTECVCERLARRWSRQILRLSGVRVRLTGEERIPRDEPCVLVCNHQSWFDVFALAAYLPGRARFVGKEELKGIPVFGPAWMACGHISIDRKDRNRAIASLEEAGRQVREESKLIVMFAEGTRSWDGRLQPFKKGAFVLAIQAGVPVLPAAVVGSRAVMPKGAWRIRPGEVEIRVGEALETESLSHRDRDRLRGEAWRAVAMLKGDGEESVPSKGVAHPTPPGQGGGGADEGDEVS